MSEVDEVETPDQQNRPILVDCEGCERTVMATVRAQSFYYEPDEGPPERWSFVTCEPKRHPMLIMQNEFSGLEFDDDSPWRAYPPQDRPLSNAIPEALRREHQEARACLKAKAYAATVVMSGRVIEGVCTEFGVKGRSLEQRLVKMKSDGHIDGPLSEWANILRGVRNAGAHFDDTKPRIERQDALDALAFNEALLDYLYVLKARFEQLRERRTIAQSDTSNGVVSGILAVTTAEVVDSTRARRRAKKEGAAAAAASSAE